MKAVDISYFSLFLCLFLLLIPVVISIKLKLGMIKNLLIAVVRMIIQLSLVGMFLKYVFEFNNPILNVGWFVVMVMVASFAATKSSGLKIKKFIFSIFTVLIAVNGFMLIYINVVIIRLEDIFDARYVIAIGGMVLGNSLRGSIIALKSFYADIKKEDKLFKYRLASGATLIEAAIPYLKHGLYLSLEPMIATMATTGIVSLPGMMTGQILGGSSPITAIKYQIVIMISIFVSMTLCVSLVILVTLKTGFAGNGIMKKDIFSLKKRTTREG